MTRMSLGGVRDEAEIRGHRKTYIGAMPGIIIQAMKRVGTKNPVIMLDEVDKMSMDFRGDPSAALLEVLDPEQNFEFHDHYLEVRELERNIASILRKIVRNYLNDKSIKKFKVNNKNLSKYLGVEKFSYAEINKEDKIGVANGLAWTAVGGVPLQIEVALLEGKGNLMLTGKLGDVMKESANAALSYARAHYSEFEIEKNFYKNKDIHIHIPEGAIPKDGPSAGITMATAIISALSKRKVKADYAMTGEITLMGDVLPIGGLEEKLVAAQRSKIKNVIIPKKNYKELVEIPKQIKKGLNIIPVENMKDVLSLVLEN